MSSRLRNIISLPAKLIGFENALRFSGQKLILPFYHAVSDTQLPHITPLYPHKSVKDFEADLDFLLKHFDPIHIDQVHTFAKKERIFSKPSFHLTFDDGLREVYTEVLPVLQKKGIPATIFVNPSFVGNKALFFRYKAALLIQELENDRIDKLPTFPFDPSVRTLADWQNWMLSARYAQSSQLDELSTLLEVDFQLFLAKEKPYLDLDELKILSRNGFAIGAHSLDHPLYRLIPVEEQIQQTTESLAWVKEHFQPQVAAFSFPFTDDGVGKQFFEMLKTETHCPDLIFGTAGLNEEFSDNHFHRIAMENRDSETEQIISSALVASSVRKLVGRNRIVRK